MFYKSLLIGLALLLQLSASVIAQDEPAAEPDYIGGEVTVDFAEAEAVQSASHIGSTYRVSRSGMHWSMT